jgi:hypothetical protein
MICTATKRTADLTTEVKPLANPPIMARYIHDTPLTDCVL